MRVLGTDFYWNAIVEDDDGKVYRLEFDSFAKRTKWVRIK